LNLLKSERFEKYKSLENNENNKNENKYNDGLRKKRVWSSRKDTNIKKV
jgi:hypothetical protein